MSSISELLEKYDMQLQELPENVRINILTEADHQTFIELCKTNIDWCKLCTQKLHIWENRIRIFFRHLQEYINIGEYNPKIIYQSLIKYLDRVNDHIVNLFEYDKDGELIEQKHNLFKIKEIKLYGYKFSEKDEYGLNELVAISSLTNLKTLTLISTNISNEDLNIIKINDNIRGLGLVNTSSINDITPLSSMNLTSLSLEGTRVKDLSPLSDMKELNYLNISKTRVISLLPLKDFEELEELDISYLFDLDYDEIFNLTGMNSSLHTLYVGGLVLPDNIKNELRGLRIKIVYD